MSGRFYGFFQDELAYLEAMLNEIDFVNVNMLIEQDPDARKIIESAAFLNAKIRKKLESAFPEITQNILYRTWPTPLFPLPSTTILQFSTRHKTQIIEKNAMALVDDGYIPSYQLHSATGRSKNIYFRTCRSLVVRPIEIDQVTLQHSPAGSVLGLKMSWGEEFKPEDLFSGITFYLGNDPSFAAQLKFYLEQHVSKVTVQYKGQNTQYKLCLCKWSCLTPEQRDAILPIDITQFQGLQKIPEFFSLPHVDDFVQLSLLSQEIDINVLFKSGGLTLTFHFDQYCSLDHLSETHFQLNCVPAINLFEYISDKIFLERTRYLLDCPENVIIHSIASINLFIMNEDGEEIKSNKVRFKSITEFEKRYHQPEETIFYYELMLDTSICDNVIYQLTFYDHQGLLIQLDESLKQHYAFQCVYLCTNSAERIDQLYEGQVSGVGNGVPKKIQVVNISKPTPSMPPLLNSKAHWKVINHFSLSVHLLAQSVEIFKMLLHDLNIYNVNGRMDREHIKITQCIEGIHAIEGKGMDWIFKGIVTRGWKLTIILRAECYQNDGELYQFGKLMVDVFSYYVEEKQFVMADIINDQSQKIGVILPIFGSRSTI